MVGFLRFLLLLSTFDWKNIPLIVNLNNQLTGNYSFHLQKRPPALPVQMPKVVKANLA